MVFSAPMEKIDRVNFKNQGFASPGANQLRQIYETLIRQTYFRNKGGTTPLLAQRSALVPLGTFPVYLPKAWTDGTVWYCGQGYRAGAGGWTGRCCGTRERREEEEGAWL